MAQMPTTTEAPLTEDAFLDDRMKFFAWFTSATFWAATAVAVILILLAIFLL